MESGLLGLACVLASTVAMAGCSDSSNGSGAANSGSSSGGNTGGGSKGSNTGGSSSADRAAEVPPADQVAPRAAGPMREWLAPPLFRPAAVTWWAPGL